MEAFSVQKVDYLTPVFVMATMYCLKCREKRDDPKAIEVMLKNGKPALKGTCPVF
jgi:Domain of unknown function (DUF5679)